MRIRVFPHQGAGSHPNAVVLVAVVILTALTACGRSREAQGLDAPAAAARGTTTSRGTAPARRAPRPPPAAVVSAPAVGYGWDGQASVGGFRGSFGHVVDAAVATLSRLEFNLDHDNSRRGVDSALIIAVNKAERPVRLEIRPLTVARVEVRVKTGAVGDRSASERLLDELGATLSRAP